MRRRFPLVCAARWAGALAMVAACLAAPLAAASEIRLKDLGRFLGWRENMLVGYGLVTGLAGSGDSTRSRATQQALANVLSQFDFAVTEDQLQSRNVAAVMITATLPPTANVGDKIDVTVNSIGDARSIGGGTLLMTPLRGPDRRVYALAQGAVSIGGYRYDANGNLAQKNHPTSGAVPAGAIVEVPVAVDLFGKNQRATFLLKDADAVSAERVAERINGLGGGFSAVVRDASSIEIDLSRVERKDLNRALARVEGLAIEPDRRARVVINERTGTVVAGGDVRIAAVAVSHGDLRVSVATEFSASQPLLVARTGPGVRSLVVGNSKLEVTESPAGVVANFPNTTVADLVQGLSQLRVSTRDTVAILQAIKAAGALYADLIIQ
jgi:flagellar P-ring protein precursor FlgI